MRWKYPLEYEVTPAVVDKGTSWLRLKLKNIGAETIDDLDVQLHSLDTYNLTVYGSLGFGAGQYLYDLEPTKEKELIFRVNAMGSADVFATIKGRKLEATSGGNTVGLISS